MPCCVTCRGGFEFEFCRWSKKVLERDGYRVFRGSSRGALGPSGTQDDLEKPFASTTSTLTRTASNNVENAIGISNNKAGVHLIVQAGRCSCELSQHTGSTLGTLVSLRDSADSLDGNLLSQHDPKDHRIHIHSWSFDHGSASRQIELCPNDTQKLDLRLTLTSIASTGSLDNSRGVRRYRLSAELREREVQPSPTQSTRPGRRRANSLPSKVPEALSPSSERESSQAWETPKPPPGRAGHGDTVGLITLSVFLAFALLLLSFKVEW